MIKIAIIKEGTSKSIEDSELTMDEYTQQIEPGLFTTFVTTGNRKNVLGLSTHLERVFSDPRSNILEQKIREKLRWVVTTFCEEGECKVRIINNSTIQDNSIIFLVEQFHPVSEDLRESGVVVGLSEIFRENPRVKFTDYIKKSNSVRSENKNSGVYESLIVKNNKIREGFTSNVYFVLNGQIITSAANILPGVTRKFVLRIIRQLGYKIKYRSLRIDELPWIQEAFLSSSSRGVIPIRRIQTVTIEGEGRGRITKNIQEQFARMMDLVAESI